MGEEVTDNVVVITGARGNLGGKLRMALADTHELRCVDIGADADGCFGADLSEYHDRWVQMFAGADAILHFAGEPRPTSDWLSAHRGNVLTTMNVLRAARLHRVPRVVFASTNQIMAGYRFADLTVTTDLPPTPLNPYAVSKLIAEELGRAHVLDTGLAFIALRIGNIGPADNVPHPGMGIGLWGQQMWLSNRDFISGVVAAMSAPNITYAVVNLVSNNPGMRWDLRHTTATIGFVPVDGFPPNLSAADLEEDSVARRAVLEPGSWLDQRFRPIKG